MQKSFSAILVAACLMLLALSASAQTFGGGTGVIGVSNVPCMTGTTPVTNYFYVSLPAKQVTIGNITSTSETVIGSYYLSLPGYTNAPLTNLYWLGSFTNSFASGTNGGSWTTNWPGGVATISFPLIMGINTGTYSNTVYVP